VLYATVLASLLRVLRVTSEFHWDFVIAGRKNGLWFLKMNVRSSVSLSQTTENSG